MTTPKIILSSHHWNLESFTDWLKQTTQIIQTTQAIRDVVNISSPIHLEIQVKRPGRPGNLEEPPRIEQIDSLRRFAEVNGAVFASLSMPVCFAHTDEAIGKEISTVDGWTDLAAYLGINQLRFTIGSDSDLLNPIASNALRQTLDYALDQDLTIGLVHECGPPALLSNFLDSAPREGGGSCGLDIPLDAAQNVAISENLRLACSHATIEAANIPSELQPLCHRWEQDPIAREAPLVILLA